MNIDDVMSVEEAAKILGYRNSSITLLCRQGKMPGAFRLGHQWVIPKETVRDYKRSPRGFAGMWENRRKAENALIETQGLEDELADRDSVEREILQYMKLLLRKIHVLEKIIAQEQQKP